MITRLLQGLLWQKHPIVGTCAGIAWISVCWIATGLARRCAHHAFILPATTSLYERRIGPDDAPHGGSNPILNTCSREARRRSSQSCRVFQTGQEKLSSGAGKAPSSRLRRSEREARSSMPGLSGAVHEGPGKLR